MPDLDLPDGRRVRWISETDDPPPSPLRAADDQTRAADAVRCLRAGEGLWWQGGWHGARQLLAAVERRLRSQEPPLPDELAARYRAHRDQTRARAMTLGGLLIPVAADGTVPLRRAPDTSTAVSLAWPDALGAPAAVAMRTMTGALSAAGWSQVGVEVPGLHGNIYPRYGVFSPTRHAYVGLLDALGPVDGRDVIDVGCGTGVLGLLLLQRGARRVLATDLDPRAVACCADNATRLGLSDRLAAVVADLLPADAAADLIVFNPPWIPEAPRTRLDRAVFDEGGQTLARFLQLAPAHLRAGGEIALLFSDLPERLGLRPPGAVQDLARSAGLRVIDRIERPATHGRARDDQDPLHRARTAERVVLLRLTPG